MDKRVSYKKYLWNRFARIYPIYFLITLFTFILQGFATGYSSRLWTLFFLNITFLRGFIESEKFSLVAQGWSLTVEETFYLIAPMIFFLLKKYGNIFYFMPIAFITCGIFLSKLLIGYDIWGGVDFVMNYTFLGRSSEFFIGISSAVLVKKASLHKMELKFCNPYWGLIVAFFLAYILSVFGSHSIFGMAVNTLLVPVICVVPIILAFTLQRGKFKIFEWRIIQMLGKSSYVFYLIHMGIVRDFFCNIGILNEGIMLVVLLFVAYMIWRYIEEPLHFKLKKLIS